jgi:hypothetical protein
VPLRIPVAVWTMIVLPPAIRTSTLVADVCAKVPAASIRVTP